MTYEEGWNRAAESLATLWRNRERAELDAAVSILATFIGSTPLALRRAIKIDDGQALYLSLVLQAIAKGYQERREVKRLGLELLSFGGDLYAGDRVRCRETDAVGWVTRVDNERESAYVIYDGPRGADLPGSEWRSMEDLTVVPLDDAEVMPT